MVIFAQGMYLVSTHSENNYELCSSSQWQVELVKVTQQVYGESVRSATMAMCEGLSSSTGAWRGLGATLLRDGIPHGIWFASYEYAKTELSDNRLRMNDSSSTSEGDIAIPMMAGAFAATTAWAVGYPVSRVRL